MPIDEMLLDLRTILEAFDAEPSHMAFAHLQHEMMRIERFCEDMLPDEDCPNRRLGENLVAHIRGNK